MYTYFNIYIYIQSPSYQGNSVTPSRRRPGSAPNQSERPQGLRHQTLAERAPGRLDTVVDSNKYIVKNIIIYSGYS